MNPSEAHKEVKRIQEQHFKGDYFASWQAGLNSTERKNLSRVKKVLNALDELNRNNLKKDDLFYFVEQLIKAELEKKYIIMPSGETYSITQKKTLKTDCERGFIVEPEHKDFTTKAQEGIKLYSSLPSYEMERLTHDFKRLFLNRIGDSKISFYEWLSVQGGCIR